MGRWLTWISAQRPVVLCLDDVHRQGPVLSLVHLLLRTHKGPLLVVAAARPEDLAEHPQQRRLLEALGGEVLVLAPLEPTTTLELVASMMPLEDGLAAEVEQRAGGNPAFAVRLVSDLVSRGALVPGPHGFGLTGPVSMPADRLAAWSLAVHRALEGRPAQDGHTLEVAAILGDHVDLEEWAAACERAGCRPSQNLLDVLADSHVVVPEVGWWRWTHPLIAESLRAGARDAGRLEALHAACAEALAALERPGGRVGRHLVGAGRHAEALPLFFAGPSLRQSASDYAELRTVVELAQQCVVALDLPADDDMWGKVALMRINAMRGRGRLDEAEAEAIALSDKARALGWGQELQGAELALADLYRIRGRLPDAEARCRTLLALPELAENFESTAMHILAEILLDLGRPLEALAQVETYLSVVGESPARAAGLFTRARARGALGEPDGATADLLAARGLHESRRDVHGVANCDLVLGLAASERREYERAEASLRSALTTYRRVGSANELIARANLGLVRLRSGRYGEAEAEILALLVEMERAARIGLAGVLRIAAMGCAADRGDWDAADEHLTAGAAHFEQTGALEGGTVTVLVDTGRSALNAGERSVAARCLDLALPMANRMRDGALVASIETLRSSVPS